MIFHPYLRTWGLQSVGKPLPLMGCSAAHLPSDSQLRMPSWPVWVPWVLCATDSYLLFFIITLIHKLVALMHTYYVQMYVMDLDINLFSYTLFSFLSPHHLFHFTQVDTQNNTIFLYCTAIFFLQLFPLPLISCFACLSIFPVAFLQVLLQSIFKSSRCYVLVYSSAQH